MRIVVTQVATKPLDDIYVAGTFNNWNPGDTKFKLQPFGRGRKAIVIKDLADGTVVEFKLTRGNFAKVETTAKGVDIT
ncbi:MAG: phosphonate ABC transporter ATP-binding protein, partial [Bacteroidetes bacterium]